jgi:hypothetical protein
MPAEMILIAIDGQWYDVTDFADDHPGGRDLLVEMNGLDASEAFHDAGHSQAAMSQLKLYKVSKPEILQAVNVMNTESSDPVLANAAKEHPITDRLLPRQQDKHSNFLASVRPYFWFILSSFMAATALVMAAYSGKYSRVANITNGLPKYGELGLGKFLIHGASKESFIYPFRLAHHEIGAMISAWICYFLHQFAQFYLILTAQQAKAAGKLKWTKEGHGWNSFAWSMAKLNVFFIALHFIQTHVFYDGLASSVPEITGKAIF